MRLACVLLVILFGVSNVHAQSKPLVALSAPPGVTVVPPVTYHSVDGRVMPQFFTVTQHVIPRYASGTSQPAGESSRSIGPAGGLVGWGPMSVIQGNPDTQKQPVPAIIVTEDFGQPTAQWSSGEHRRKNYKPAILRPVLRDCTIAGHDETGSNYVSGGVVNNEPGKHNPADKFPDLHGGAFIQASGAVLENVTAFYIPGTAFRITRSGAVNAGAFGPWDVEKTIVRNCGAHRAYRGFDVHVVDAVVGTLQGYALRDYGIKFTAGSAQIDGAIHFWGVSPGPCVWFPKGAGACWGGPFYVENSPIGMLVESAGNQLGPIYSKQCRQTNLRLTGARNTLGPIDFEVSGKATGIAVEGQFNKLLGGSVTLGTANAVGVSIAAGANSGNGLVIRDIRFLGSSPTAGTAITTSEVLNNATIHAHFQDVGTAIDVYPDRGSKLGTANDIDITTSRVTTPIRLPPKWHPSNRIRVNGVVQQPSG